MITQNTELLLPDLFTCAEMNEEALDQVFESSNGGLTQQEAERRLKLYGENIIQEGKRKSLVLKFLDNFTHLMAILLWVGGAVAFIAQLPQLGIAICSVNIINGVFSFWQEFRAEKATQALKKMLPVYSLVIRDGRETRISASDLVPGDLILLTEGDRISADCRLIQQNNLRVDQATLTGESHPVGKSVEVNSAEKVSNLDLPNIVYAGTSVFSGSAKAIVLSTGMKTEFGKIARLTQGVEDELSPLQREMKQVTRVVSLVSVLVGVLFFLFAIGLAHITLAESFIFTLGMIVAFVPEGLLPTVTLSLAMGTQRMARHHALVKKLSSVESLGCTTVICTDKTGTLTQNSMTVRTIWLPSVAMLHPNGRLPGYSLSVTGQGTDAAGRITFSEGELSRESAAALRQLLEISSRCNNARVVKTLDAKNGKTIGTILGDPTEVALQVVARKGGIDIEEDAVQSARMQEIPFDSYRKRMSVIVRTDHGETVLYCKGAPKEVLEKCSRINISGINYEMTAEFMHQILRANDYYSSQGQRILAFAMRRIDSEYDAEEPEKLEEGMTFIGLTAMIDPPRPEVESAVKKCHTAGIRVIMITGDYGLTALSIARQTGIVKDENARVLAGSDVEQMTDDALKEALRGEVIFARATPEHKLRIVRLLQELGNVVAVTGDGVNDAPALKKADIGIAMGMNGSDVAKEAADVVLTDDNFATIIHAIEEGRAVYENIKKFTTYIFTSNMPEAVPFVFYAFSAARIPLALNVMHVLSIDLGTDIVPALALGAELPEAGSMQRPPRRLSEHIITPKLMIRAYLFLGLIQSLAAMAAFYYKYWTNGYFGQWVDLPVGGELYRSATAMALAAVVVTQVGNLLAQRSERNSIFRIPAFSNLFLYVGILSELLIVAAIIYMPALQQFVGTGPITLRDWAFLLALCPLLLVADELRKRWVSRKERKNFLIGK